MKPGSVSAPPELVILDRDGTLIDFVRDEELGAVTPAFHPDQIRLLPGAIEGLLRLANLGVRLAIATNQPGPAKGQISLDAVRRTNDALVEQLASHGLHIEGVEVCMHHPAGSAHGLRELIRKCDCRKPEPGMLNTLLRRLACDPRRTWMIGDTQTDIDAAQRAGIGSILLMQPGRCELCPIRGQRTVPTAVAADLLEASLWLTRPR